MDVINNNMNIKEFKQIILNLPDCDKEVHFIITDETEESSLKMDSIEIKDDEVVIQFIK